MKLIRKSIALAVIAAVASAGVYAQEKPKAQKPVPVPAVKAAAAPKLDGVADDAVWKTAPVVKFEAVKGVNFKDGKGNTAGTVQAAYTADMVYLLITYDDPTMSAKHSPYVKKADGKWEKMKDPADKGGDNNLVYEDKFALIWNISSPAFEQRGCLSACHTGEGKPFGNKYTKDPGERLDIWHWKGVRTGPVGQIDDQYVDSTR